jgi:hypothetical protein
MTGLAARALAGWTFVACGALLWLGGDGSLRAVRTLDAWAHGRAAAAPYVCAYRARTGRPCVGCGGTHAFDHAARGHFGAAVAANPLGAAVGLGAWLLLGVAAVVVATGRRGILGAAYLSLCLGLSLATVASLGAWWLSMRGGSAP